MTSLAALDSNQIGTIGIGAIIAVVVIGFLLSMIISALVGRIIILIIVIALGSVVWQQRASVLDNAKKCQFSVTFFGAHVDAPTSLRQQCDKLHNRIGAVTK